MSEHEDERTDEQPPERGFTLKDPPGGASESQQDLPSIDFSTFVLSLGASAMMHLGRAPDPTGGASPPEKNLPLARQTIDTLEMLEVKTRGNLADDESRLLQSVLYELRMEFVQARETNDS